MSGIWQLFTSDLRRATRSVMAVIVLCGLVVIPSAFTWFNVIGSWDPFGNTKNLKVAVASVDKGYTSPLIPVHVNIGSVVESALRANDQLDWVITSEDEAIAGTTSGEYYAAMVLPEDFSERMLTFYTAGSQRTQVDYYTNDKSNPLAPLITSEGADDLTAMINAEFTKELSNVALSLVSALTSSLGDPGAEAALVRIEAHVGDVAVQMRAASGTASMFTALIEASIPLIESASDLLSEVEAEFSSAAGTVREGITAAERAEGAVGRAAEALSTAFSASSAQLDRFGSEVDSIFSGVDEDAAATTAKLREMTTELDELIADHEALRDSLRAVETSVPEDQRPALTLVIDGLDTAIEQERALAADLERMSGGIAEGNQHLQQFRGQIETRVAAAQESLTNASTIYANDLQPVLQELGRTLVAVGAALNAVTEDVTGASSSSGDIVSLLEAAAQDNTALAEALSTAADEVAGVADALSTAIGSGDLGEIGTIIGANPSVLAAAIAQPIGLQRIPVYPVVSFGAGMAPLYSILSLWVGALLLAVTLRVDPPSRAFAEGPRLTVNQQFLGRYAVFALMGLAQSTLVMLGNIFLVGLQPVHPFLLLLTGWVSSLVFTFIIYTLVVSFSDAGKALAVFLLVIQVAGAGGAYPLVLLPDWFQNVSPFLPATHSIDAFRAALAGIYQADYWISIAWLLAFLVPMLLLGLALRKPLIGFNEKMEAMLQSTKLM
ncbi:YhgE/Pip domain-containing protein [Agromyces aerolatus]|uniref:YhgE/Pip domain-containing protein n=1 Tax=Agromyces sp. LY-1074 TaxID=3074080 RepID=UPI002866221A|nr:MULTISPECIES: YhgE/Pip domain-containing protein [unclassified Agromyces]MDR5700841.1 YhgE/Pip domain-containing protein [Agromyces sp. LY-1074]MDR5707362.1 YhgE/Pip domain-containing protein [Agromyces sp. LY-1358]